MDAPDPFLILASLHVGSHWNDEEGPQAEPSRIIGIDPSAAL
jgi:hypothetical protein